MGRLASARSLLVAAVLSCGTPAVAQNPAAPAAAVAPDNLITAKLVWSTMAALDHANRTGNYSVLRDLGTPSFQANNSAATLGSVFEQLRSQRLDLSNTLIVVPQFEFPPAVQPDGLLRVRGTFPLRPTQIGFDLLFQNSSGEWRLFAIAVVPLASQPTQPPPPRR